MKDFFDNILVAIKCLAYNHEPYIRECLEGFVMQKTNFRFVAIVHDDASTDKTADIIREYEAKYPEIIKPIYETENQYSKHDGSIGRIMNAAIDATGAKYVALCEGDDYWTDPYKLQKQVDFLEEHEEYSMCFHRSKVLLEKMSEVYLNCFQIEDRDYGATELFQKWIVPTASIVYRNTAPFPKLIASERILNGDIVLVEKCAHVGLVRGISEFMSVYRIQYSGVTYNEEMSKNRTIRYPEHFEFIRDNFPKIDDRVVNIRISSSYFDRAMVRDSMNLRFRDLKSSYKADKITFFKCMSGMISQFFGRNVKKITKFVAHSFRK